jgi:hypothetical protein
MSSTRYTFHYEFLLLVPLLMSLWCIDFGDQLYASASSYGLSSFPFFGVFA